jgi:Cu/Zn superoxide dismutase
MRSDCGRVMTSCRPNPQRGLRDGPSRRASVAHWHRASVAVGTSRVAVCASIALLAACSSFRGAAPQPSAVSGAPSENYGQQATLRPIGGSAISGKIRVVDRGNTDATVLVSIINIPTGAYRIAFHERPNCSSPNAFSAGPAWAPASTGKAPRDLLPTQYANSEARGETELRVAGLRATGNNGVAGHAVVLYAGNEVTEARPDVSNAAIACGVFEPARPLSF